MSQHFATCAHGIIPLRCHHPYDARACAQSLEHKRAHQGSTRIQETKQDLTRERLSWRRRNRVPRLLAMPHSLITLQPRALIRRAYTCACSPLRSFFFALAAT